MPVTGEPPREASCVGPRGQLLLSATAYRPTLLLIVKIREMDTMHCVHSSFCFYVVASPIGGLSIHDHPETVFDPVVQGSYEIGIYSPTL